MRHGILSAKLYAMAYEFGIEKQYWGDIGLYKQNSIVINITEWVKRTRIK